MAVLYGTLATVLSSSYLYALAGILSLIYVVQVRRLRYRRRDEIMSTFQDRPLSSMTTEEAHHITTQLHSLEFPFSFHKAQQIALLKAGGIPTMTKLFAVTGQMSPEQGPKRAVDTEIILREARANNRTSERYMNAVARMNYLHARWRKAGKILDQDMLHTLGSGIVETFSIIDSQEWRTLSDVEKCALGIYHKNLGEDMLIPYAKFLPSHESGWRDGLHFANELRDWTVQYEREAAVPHEKNAIYTRTYVDGKLRKLPGFLAAMLKRAVAYEVTEPMRSALFLEPPGPVLTSLLELITTTRKLYLRHLALPRSSSRASELVNSSPNKSGLYNIPQLGLLQPYYNEPTSWQKLIKPRMGDEKYSPNGYSLKTIGPKLHEGKGLEDMAATVEYLKQNTLTSCPFGAAMRERVHLVGK